MACLVLFPVIAHAHGSPAWFIGSAAGAGLFLPRLSPAIRQWWTSVLTDSEERRRAFALETVVVEGLFMVGPLFVVPLVHYGPAAPLFVAAALTGAGCGAFLTAVARWPATVSESASKGWGVLAERRIRIILLSVLALGGTLGALEVCVTAIANRSGLDNGLIGLMLALYSGGSMLGGILYGSIQTQRPLVVQVILAYVWIGGTWAVFAFVGRPFLVMMPLLIGLGAAPAYTMLSLLLARYGGDTHVAEGYAWFSTAIQAGASLGAASVRHCSEGGHSSRRNGADDCVRPIGRSDSDLP